MEQSLFSEPVRQWFGSRFGAPTAIQRSAWPLIRTGQSCLISAGTGQGKSLAAVLPLADRLLSQPGSGRVLYLAPLKALSNNLAEGLLEQLGQLSDQGVGRLKVAVRTGDTVLAERRRQLRRPPDLLLTTPESLFVLLGSRSGRRLMAGVRSVIVDELHALAGSKRGAHLAVSLERLQALLGQPDLQRVGLSATARPLHRLARFLVGQERPCQIVEDDQRHPPRIVLEFGPAPLTSLAGTTRWRFVADRIAELAGQGGPLLAFCNTRALVERLAAELAVRLGEARVAAHHGSLGLAQRERVEEGLRRAELSVVVCSSSLELGIDVGRLDRVIQVGSIGSLNALRQRAGRSRHRPDQVPLLHLFPLTLVDLLDAHALCAALDAGRIEASDKPVQPPLDVLAQQLVAMVSTGPMTTTEAWAIVRRAAPFQALPRQRFDDLIRMLHDGYVTARETGRGPIRRGAADRLYPAADGVRRSRRNVGTIPEWFDYEVIATASGQVLGRLDEEFAFESAPGQVFQLGGEFFKIDRIGAGRVEVHRSESTEAALPFWAGDGIGRSRLVSLQVCRLLAQAARGRTLPDPQLETFISCSRSILGSLPGPGLIILERFPDPGGDEHLVIHAPFGLRINRAWGLALRKRFCRQFNFELQAVASDNAVLISLGATHSFPLAEVIAYLHSATLADVVTQAVLDTPQFATRFRWCATTALAIERRDEHGRVAAALQRNRAENLIARIFPDQLACLENLSGPRQVPDHPLVRQALDECLSEHMDLPGLIRIYRRIESGRIKIRAIETAQPSPLAMAVIHAPQHAFLDPADAEERRTRSFEVQPSGPRPASGGVDDHGLLPNLSTAERLEQALQRFVYLPAFQAERAGATDAFRRLAARRAVFAVSDMGAAAPVWVHSDHLACWLTLCPQARIHPYLSDRMRPAGLEADEALRRVVLGALRRARSLSEDDLVRETAQTPTSVRSALIGLQAEGLARVASAPDQAACWTERSVLPAG
ncbi:MAG: DEAD/DEAH box helicase [Wenzhouxiangella sp.]